MAETVRLTVLTGPHKGRRFCFRGPTVCRVGRAEDCFVRFAGSERDQSISRHHCQLHLDPPCIRLQDLGSKNGTYVNGKAIADQAAQDMAALLQGNAPIAAVQDGDIITIGGSSFQIEVVDCPPRLPEGAEHDPVWQPDELAKKDCPIRC
jgi:pSer/pThr/pTyr-binding forkhead associated (FHA) protein